MKKYDVIVVGAGPAGCVAALQAARAGAKTLLIEKSSMPGGTTTIGGVHYPGLFHAWGKQVIAGIGWELVSKAVDESGIELPDFSRYNLPHWQLQVKINPFVYACLLDEAFTKSGVDVLYHAMPQQVCENDNEVIITTATKDGLKDYSCSIAIDATGDADVTALAGHAVRRPEEKQPATQMFRIDNYDIEKLDLDHIEEEYKKEVAAGRMSYLDTGMSRSMANLLRIHGNNCVHIKLPDAATSADKSRAEQEGRAVLLRIYRFLKRFPGLENLRIRSMAPQCGIRETATVVGQTTITVDDYESGKKWDDSLCYAFYPIDLHVNDKSGGLMNRKLQFGTVPTVPRGALIPETSQRILVAGRCVSSDRLANSALRVQASCMAMGQAAGAMGALSASSGNRPADLNLNEIKELLHQHKAITP